MQKDESVQLQVEGEPSGGAEQSPLATPPETPEKPTEAPRSHKNAADTLCAEDARYVKLDPEYAATLTWSNDPRHLDLHGAFSMDKPNLSSDFHVQGLRPIVKEEDGETWILQDAKGAFYLWDIWDGHLLRVTEKWTKGPELETVEDVVDNIVCNLSFVEDDAIKVFRTYD